uniref:Putative single-stranded DNA binding protein n=1 Tax=Schimmelmannia schousboei TaxID=173468 RepID=A0A1C9C8M7_9FLOR|nr:putative single-stranded DNA binding protein [Schimmelmannia schousboei]AOM64733.1 putative single-stranded DNA binding protein [Schimmelmannia schousboei]
MNICLISVKIISQPRLVRLRKKTIVYALMSTPNNKRGLLFYKIQATFKGKLAKDFHAVYRKDDMLLLEGNIYNKIKLKSTNHNRKQHCVVIKVRKIHL